MKIKQWDIWFYDVKDLIKIRFRQSPQSRRNAGLGFWTWAVFSFIFQPDGEENGEVRWRRCTAVFIWGLETESNSGPWLSFCASASALIHSLVSCNYRQVEIWKYSSMMRLQVANSWYPFSRILKLHQAYCCIFFCHWFVWKIRNKLPLQFTILQLTNSNL